ncbi:MAG: amidohydrolase family protein [Kofleriaceae bacterium]|nr:amidohydrolase family protein [Kofleriaceae bacterium]MCB9571573.1 amidohydrolase family protein [Kofleriaceae bacterium]
MRASHRPHRPALPGAPRRRGAAVVAALIATGLTGAGCRRGGDHAAPAATPAHRAVAGDVAIVGATVVPMDRDGALPGTPTVLIHDGSIAAIAPAADVDTAAATVVDGHGKWLVPGLADMHVHLWGEGDLGLLLLEGVTTVRDMFGSPRQLDWRARIAAGSLAGPTLITAGPIFDGDPPTWPGSAVVTTPAAARAEVDAQADAGYDWIKVYDGLSAEVYAAIVDEARARHLPVGGHVPRAVGLAGVLAAGQRSIEHLTGYVPFSGDRHVGPDDVAATVAAGVWNVPTLVVTDHLAHLDDPASLAGTRGLEHVSSFVRNAWEPRNDFRLQAWTAETFAAARAGNVVRRQLVADLAKAGAHLALGTDTGNPYVIPGFAVHDELALLVDAGLTPAQALHAATAAAAELQGTPAAFGVIAAGARADLLLVDHDPLVDVGALAAPPVVIVRGVVHARADLLAAVEAAEHPVDRYAGLPALEVEGTKVVEARYDVSFRDQVIGGERARLSTAPDGARIVRGQAVFELPQRVVLTYRAAPDTLDVTVGDAPTIHVTRRGAEVVTGDLAVDVGADAVIAPQAVAEFFAYAPRLADLEIGASRPLVAAEVVTDGGLRLTPGRFTFTRQPDADGRRVYGIAGTHGELDLTGTFSVDPDGAPHQVSLTVRFGTFVTTRVE